MVIVISVIMLHVGPTQVDRTIDLCGGPPRGTGLQNLRECIIGISTLHKDKKKLLLVLIMLPYYCLLCRDEVEIRRGPGGQAERMETDDSKLHAKVQKPHTPLHHHLDNEHSHHHHVKVKSLILTISTIMIIVAIKGQDHNIKNQHHHHTYNISTMVSIMITVTT